MSGCWGFEQIIGAKLWTCCWNCSVLDSPRCFSLRGCLASFLLSAFFGAEKILQTLATIMRTWVNGGQRKKGAVSWVTFCVQCLRELMFAGSSFGIHTEVYYNPAMGRTWENHVQTSLPNAFSTSPPAMPGELRTSQTAEFLAGLVGRGVHSSEPAASRPF